MIQLYILSSKNEYHVKLSQQYKRTDRNMELGTDYWSVKQLKWLDSKHFNCLKFVKAMFYPLVVMIMIMMIVVILARWADEFINKIIATLHLNIISICRAKQCWSTNLFHICHSLQSWKWLTTTFNCKHWKMLKLSFRQK